MTRSVIGYWIIFSATTGNEFSYLTKHFLFNFNNVEDIFYRNYGKRAFIMMKIYSFLLTLPLALLACIPVRAGVYEPDKLRVYLKMDKRVLYSDEDVVLQICIKNVSEKKNFFDVFDSIKNKPGEYTTFQPLVYDYSGREAEITVPYKLEKRDIKELIRDLERRMVELAPGEVFIHSINLKHIYKLDLNTRYRVKSLFYPTIGEDIVITSDNELSFKIIAEKRYNKPSEREAVQRNISPSEVILLTLRAEKDKNWDNYLKYIDVEKFINAYPEYTQKYLRANFEEKNQIEKDFIKYLTRDRDDYLLHYKIMEEEIENSKRIAYVNVIEDRYGSRWNYRYRCRYMLEQYKDMWLIVDEVATVMQGAKR